MGIKSEELDKTIAACIKKQNELDKLKKSEENQEKISKLEKDIETLRRKIDRLKVERIDRYKKIEKIGEKIPEELKKSSQYEFAASGYILQNTTPYIGDVTVTDDGKVIFKYGGLEDVDDGRRVMQYKDDLIYIFEDIKAYDYATGENLVNRIVKVERINVHPWEGGKWKKFSIRINLKQGQWSYEENERSQWKDIEDVSELPIAELLLNNSVDHDLAQFFYENYKPLPKKEATKEETNFEQEDMEPIPEDALTVEKLKRDYDFVYDDGLILDKDAKFVSARRLEDKGISYVADLPIGTIGKKSPTDYLFFKHNNGMVTPIPELTTYAEGDVEGRHYKSLNHSTYQGIRKGIHVFDAHEWGFDISDDEDLEQINRYDNPYIYNKYYRYVTLDNSQKLIKVFESDKEIEHAEGGLYHRNKDENGKQCIRLVDLAGNIHSIKEGGKAGEKGLKEKTFGPKSKKECQLKVIYKDDEPIYALFIGNDDIDNYEFCTAKELREFYERQKRNFKRRGWYMEEDSCFAQMEEIIGRFNHTFMQGNFVPSTDEIKKQESKKPLKELSEELADLTSTEEQFKQELGRCEQQLHQKNERVGQEYE